MQGENEEVLVLSPTRAGFWDKYKLLSADHGYSPGSPGWPRTPYAAEHDSELLGLPLPLPRAGVTGISRHFCSSVMLEPDLRLPATEANPLSTKTTSPAHVDVHPML